MIDTEPIDDAGPALGRCGKRGVPVSAPLGRHASDLMVSFCVRAPGGFGIEDGAGGRPAGDATRATGQTTAISLWGHRFSGTGH